METMSEKEKKERREKAALKTVDEYDLDGLTAEDVAYIRGAVDATVSVMKQMRKEKSA